MSRHSHPIRRASDNRRAKWRRLNAYQRLGAQDGNLALAVDETPPLRVIRQRQRLILCDGLAEIVGRIFRFQWVYLVKIGNRVYEWTEQRVIVFWQDYYRTFAYTQGTTERSATTAVVPLLPAPRGI